MFNVIRPTEIPHSLTLRKDYKGEDVLNALKVCFHKKCYLCETKEPHDINIEHFIPHEGDLHLKFDWNNLYLVCSRCNNIKLADRATLLDCCDTTQDVSKKIKILPPCSPYAKKMLIEPNTQDDVVLNTASLLDKIYNSEHTINKEVTGSFLRKKVFDEMIDLTIHMINYLKKDTLEIERPTILLRIKKLTESESPFSSVATSQILEDEYFASLIFPSD
ncbi:hypothetical protein OGX83_09790 [Citrobacter sp. Cpo074]|uniref:HNH endonuclease n=1 Tax=Citrobacter sp. Cpo074 TaxID=2985135 RepID=UPI002575375A|nr:hypothetical protein [Citrobacter sp. Cpo074]MDM2848783.1 hypothetical protein [Citrobacter sp. Cpo074]